ncbi:MAG: Hpt domain-containing protein [Planctomycetaceae bacterium]|jgi:HPt (histidine-containing phosphotransfer) domain-containing protein|nr:Hpt domain-containing protein [Planctomycetaceae bacterium]
MKPIYSSLTDDPEILELVSMFVNEMPKRIAQFNALLESDDTKGLLNFAHQLKGSAGSYGFAELSSAAAEIVSAIKNEKPKNKIIVLVKNLIELCNSASVKPKNVTFK